MFEPFVRRERPDREELTVEQVLAEVADKPEFQYPERTDALGDLEYADLAGVVHHRRLLLVMRRTGLGTLAAFQALFWAEHANTPRGTHE